LYVVYRSKPPKSDFISKGEETRVTNDKLTNIISQKIIIIKKMLNL